jgi:hypothetical protein
MMLYYGLSVALTTMLGCFYFARFAEIIPLSIVDLKYLFLNFIVIGSVISLFIARAKVFNHFLRRAMLIGVVFSTKSTY